MVRLLLFIFSILKRSEIRRQQSLPATTAWRFPAFAKAAAQQSKFKAGNGRHQVPMNISCSFLGPQSFFFLLITLLFAVMVMPLSAAFAASVDLEWDANTESVLEGYKIYWGTSSGSYTSSMDVGNKTSCTVNGLEEGQTYYFAATAYDGQNNESGYSNQITFTVPAPDNDGDGVPDIEDEDDDNDQMPDAWEIQYGLDPLVDDANKDFDGDGLSNLEEYLNGTNPIVPEENVAPAPPALTSPANNAVVELTPVLRTGAFHDNNADDFHLSTHWQIFRESDDLCVYDITSEYSLTEIQIPRLILNGDQNYRWKARYYDQWGVPSEWSGNGSFTTQTDTADSDGNGIPDDQEINTPADLDGDGTLDADQHTIKCVSTGKDKALGISFKGSENVVEIESMSAESIDDNDILSKSSGNPDDFPFGLINFKLIMNQPGDSAEIKIHFSEPAPENGVWFKYDPIEATWTDYSAQSVFSEDRRSLTLYLQDGGDGDVDGTVNGIIVDPSGLALLSSGSESAGGGGGGGGGASPACFISAAASQPGSMDAGQIWHRIYGRELAIGLVLLAMLKILTVALRRRRKRWEETQRRQQLYYERGGRFTARNLMPKG